MRSELRRRQEGDRDAMPSNRSWINPCLLLTKKAVILYVRTMAKRCLTRFARLFFVPQVELMSVNANGVLKPEPREKRHVVFSCACC